MPEINPALWADAHDWADEWMHPRTAAIVAHAAANAAAAHFVADAIWVSGNTMAPDARAALLGNHRTLVAGAENWIGRLVQVAQIEDQPDRHRSTAMAVVEMLSEVLDDDAHNLAGGPGEVA